MRKDKNAHRAAGRMSATEKLVCAVVIVSMAVFILFPYYWMVMTSLKPTDQIMQVPPVWWPRSFEWYNYVKVWRTLPLSRYVGNSIFTAGSGALLGLLLSTSAAFSLACFKSPIRKASIALMLFTQLIPFTLPFVAFYQMMYAFRLTNTYQGLIAAYCIWSIPFCTLTMRSYFAKALPQSVLESARIDGCTRFGMYYRIGLPLVVPGLVATAIFAFIIGWNDFVWASVMLVDNAKKTAAIGIYDYVGQSGTISNIGLSMTTAVLITIPTMILFGFLQKHLVSGLTAGAVKG